MELGCAIAACGNKTRTCSFARVYRMVIVGNANAAGRLVIPAIFPDQYPIQGLGAIGATALSAGPGLCASHLFGFSLPGSSLFFGGQPNEQPDSKHRVLLRKYLRLAVFGGQLLSSTVSDGAVMLPQHPQRRQRWATTTARQSLAKRFGLSYGPQMQDWEWEVADPERIAEFLAAYSSGDLNDDERFSLMEMLVQSVADLHLPSLEESVEWKDIAALLRESPRLHASTIYYWSGMGDAHGWLQIGEAMQKLLREVEPLLA